MVIESYWEFFTVLMFRFILYRFLFDWFGVGFRYLYVRVGKLVFGMDFLGVRSGFYNWVVD